MKLFFIVNRMHSCAAQNLHDGQRSQKLEFFLHCKTGDGIISLRMKKTVVFLTALDLSAAVLL